MANIISKIIDDEQFQNDMYHPSFKSLIESSPAYDRVPNGTGRFGLSVNNPIPVNGPIGEIAYLSRIATKSGERILFHRIGAINNIDVFEAVTISGSKWFILFLDHYHPRQSRLYPFGFRLYNGRGLFAGFHKFCPNFPYDFEEMKQKVSDSALIYAYIPMSFVSKQIEDAVFSRTSTHIKKIKIVKKLITSIQMQ